MAQAVPARASMQTSFLGSGLLCAWVGTVLLVVATATEHWMQYRLAGTLAHQGLWRYCLGPKCFLQTEGSAYWNATRAFMILASVCATSGLILGILAFAKHPVLSRLSRPFSAGIMCLASTLFVLLALAVYTGVAISVLGRRFGDWRFSWSYILGWVAMLLTFFAGIFYMCARMSPHVHSLLSLSVPASPNLTLELEEEGPQFWRPEILVPRCMRGLDPRFWVAAPDP